MGLKMRDLKWIPFLIISVSFDIIRLCESYNVIKWSTYLLKFNEYLQEIQYILNFKKLAYH